MAGNTGTAVAKYLAEAQDLELSSERAAEVAAIATRLNRVTLDAAMQRPMLDDPARYYAVLAGAVDSKTEAK